MNITLSRCSVCGRDIPDTQLALTGHMDSAKGVEPECQECFNDKFPTRDFRMRWTLRELRDGTVPALRWWYIDHYLDMRDVEVEDADDSLGMASPWPYADEFDG